MASYVRKLYRRFRYGAPVVVVSGLPRSGTSMAMKMLEAGGLNVVSDGVRTADEDNPKGYYEDERVKDLHKMEDKSWLRDARGQAIKVISWLLKDLPEEYNYKVIFMRRHLEEVLASQTKMLERRGEESQTDDERMMDLYKNHLWRVGYLFKHGAHIESLDVDYKEALEKPAELARRMKEFLGLDLDLEKMAGVVDTKLYRNRKA